MAEETSTLYKPPGTAELVHCLFRTYGIVIPVEKAALFQHFLVAERNKALADVIRQTGELLMAGWKTEERIRDIVQQPVRIPNATMGKPYEAPFDPAQWGWNDIDALNFAGLEEMGLAFDAETKTIRGTPTQSGDLGFVFLFRLQGQPEDAALAEKKIPIIINPDPKSLWKNVDSNKEDPFWKKDNVTVFTPLGGRHLLVSSKRGRSHANVGSFREDDFGFASLENDWCLVAVSDGAGSAKLSRKGSALACETVVAHFQENSHAEKLAGFDAILQQYRESVGPETQKALNHFVYENLGKAVFAVHKRLEAFANEQGASLKDLSATFIFVLFKKYPEGYVFLSFGVGDCPIAVLNRDRTEITLMNWLDVGEFGGGTRFVTMPEIFQNKQFATRFGFKLMDDFSYLFLMSDGIYDPKFVVEAALPKVENWQAFLADLNGANEDRIGVELNPDNKEIEAQLSRWMDFWSPGNHDDRTLAIVF